MQQLYTTRLFTSMALAAALICGSAAGSNASIMRAAGMPGTPHVNVNVSLNMQFPLADDDPKTLSDAQLQGRKMIYALAISECPVLLETIAATCRLTNLNVSTQLRDHSNNGQIGLYVNGNAQFAITLKENGNETTGQ